MFYVIIFNKCSVIETVWSTYKHRNLIAFTSVDSATQIYLNSEFNLHKLTLFFLLPRTNSSPPHTTRSVALNKQLLSYHVLQSDDLIPDLSPDRKGKA